METDRVERRDGWMVEGELAWSPKNQPMKWERLKNGCFEMRLKIDIEEAANS